MEALESIHPTALNKLAAALNEWHSRGMGGQLINSSHRRIQQTAPHKSHAMTKMTAQ